ncbi:MAG TPA: 4-(cytidine 5'-diphospho)-2-C-methyl-D-erythritol kinase [Terriglobales bacterium]|nr:4-(cytidine 5'-diphospho)-2-C-methyl-D-erythritol kinase [Terriglobales bacterium]
MSVSVRSFAKINIGLRIGPVRPDGFHELRTLYQTIGLHDVLRVTIARGSGIEIRSNAPAVPQDESNTCYRVAERVLHATRRRAKVTITIEKKLPVQGGLGGASSNAVATLLALERALRRQLPPEDRMRIAAEVGSDLPLFLLGGLVLGSGRGEEVYPLEDMPGIPCVVATPAIGVSTPQAFARWDRLAETGSGRRGKLTAPAISSTINGFSHSVLAWLSGSSTGVPSRNVGDRAEALLLDLVRAGIENDFERVVFPEYPELRKVKRALERAGARYGSLSGSGSTVYGLFASSAEAKRAAVRLTEGGIRAQVTTTLPRRQYWRRMFV